MRVFDPGFMNTAVLESKITYIDGEQGILRYRGYPIEQLAESSKSVHSYVGAMRELIVHRCSFLESAYLLIYGELPTSKQFATFSGEVMNHTTVHRDMESMVSSFRFDAHPMAILTSSSVPPSPSPSLRIDWLATDSPRSVRSLRR